MHPTYVVGVFMNHGMLIPDGSSEYCARAWSGLADFFSDIDFNQHQLQIYEKRSDLFHTGTAYSELPYNISTVCPRSHFI